MQTVEPVTVKVTRLKNIGYGIRIWYNGVLWAERAVKTRREVSLTIASDLRMIDKCGGRSPMASASRDRVFCQLASDMAVRS